MKRDNHRRREPVLVGSARKHTKGGPLGDTDEAVIGLRFYA